MKQQRAGDLLLLAPGAVQIFYGDESGREFGPTGSDPLQGTRSDMNWNELTGEKGALLAHWQKSVSSAPVTQRLVQACSCRNKPLITMLLAANIRAIKY